ncbi:carbonic anhydrase [Luteolibacter soli]|uniref:Carbonic anhydrase n=1 Tax=Luteolibacter soli TaxID=3135280 RepID=A0ABU9B6C8_9BACT
MNAVEELTRRNSAFAASRFIAGLKMMPSLKTTIIGCVDPRVDPSALFGLAPGEAAVIRNVGGRIFPSTLQTMAMLRTVSRSNGAEMGEGWNLIVLHHTDCGINCLVHSPEILAKHFGVEASGLDELAITDPYRSVALDVAALKSNPQLPAGVIITGMVYDVSTGVVETVATTGPSNL